jgi:hypothetical protein
MTTITHCATDHIKLSMKQFSHRSRAINYIHYLTMKTELCIQGVLKMAHNIYITFFYDEI